MSKFRKAAASEALTVLDSLAEAPPDSESVAGFSELCKQADIDDSDADYFVKYARRFEDLSNLSTEELVKLSLRRFMKDRDTDAILRGIERNSRNDGVKCAAVCRMLGEQDLTEDAEGAAIISSLEKRAYVGMAQLAARGAGGLAALGRPAAAAASQGSRLPSILGGAALGAGAGVGAPRLANYLSERYGPGAGQRRFLQEHGPAFAQSMAQRGNIEPLVAMMQQMGGKVSPEWWDLLNQAISYRRNPWLPSYYG